MPSRSTIFGTLILALSTLLLSACAVSIMNESQNEISEFYVAPAGSSDMGPNLFKDGETLQPGGITIVIAEGVAEDTCVLDIRYVGASVDRTERGFNSCDAESNFTIR